MEYTYLQTRPHPLELRTRLVLANGDFGSVLASFLEACPFYPVVKEVPRPQGLDPAGVRL